LLLVQLPQERGEGRREGKKGTKSEQKGNNAVFPQNLKIPEKRKTITRKRETYGVSKEEGHRGSYLCS